MGREANDNDNSNKNTNNDGTTVNGTVNNATNTKHARRNTINTKRTHVTGLSTTRQTRDETRHTLVAFARVALTGLAATGAASPPPSLSRPAPFNAFTTLTTYIEVEQHSTAQNKMATKATVVRRGEHYMYRVNATGVN